MKKEKGRYWGPLGKRNPTLRLFFVRFDIDIA